MAYVHRTIPLLFLFVLSGCASHYTADSVPDSYGLFSGIWHGMLFPLAVIANLISWAVGLLGISFLDSIQIIGRPNTGFWYYVGFAIGLFGYSTGARS